MVGSRRSEGESSGPKMPAHATSSAARARQASPSRDKPTLTTLTHSECEVILARNVVGRLAFSFHDRVDIEPLHYVFSEGWLYGRTSPGSKLDLLGHSRWVAFEVDEVEGLFDWRSVVVHGGFYILLPAVSKREAATWLRGIEILRELLPETWAADDPVPFRTVLFRIQAETLTGRASATHGESSSGER